MSLYMVIEKLQEWRCCARVPTVSGARSACTEGVILCFELGERNAGSLLAIDGNGRPRLLDEWIANWSDIIDFEIYPVVTSKEAADKISPAPKE